MNHAQFASGQERKLFPDAPPLDLEPGVSHEEAVEQVSRGEARFSCSFPLKLQTPTQSHWTCNQKSVMRMVWIGCAEFVVRLVHAVAGRLQSPHSRLRRCSCHKSGEAIQEAELCNFIFGSLHQLQAGSLIAHFLTAHRGSKEDAQAAGRWLMVWQRISASIVDPFLDALGARRCHCLQLCQSTAPPDFRVEVCVPACNDLMLVHLTDVFPHATSHHHISTCNA